MKKILNSSNPYFQKSMNLYGRYEKYLPIASFFAGFSWDSLTLSRIDQLFDNFTLLTYLLLLGGFIVLTNLIDKQIIKAPFWLKYREWYPLAIQFFLGGLFSAYVVFYFQSADLSKNWMFLGLLVVLLVANEFFKNRLTNLYFQMALFFLASFSFFIFFLPVITSIMNVWMFLLGGLLSLLLVGGILYLLYRLTAINSMEELWRVCALVLGIYLVLNLFYFNNWIPPIPLSLREGGIYHHVSRVGEQYQLKFEKPEWYQFFKDSDDEFHYAAGDSIFCFASVFAPARLQTTLYHRWQQYQPAQGDWVTTDRIVYHITGGRGGGYRSYTFKRFFKSGEWRVRIETESEQLLGTLHFTVKEVPTRAYELVTTLR